MALTQVMPHLQNAEMPLGATINKEQTEQVIQIRGEDRVHCHSRFCGSSWSKVWKLTTCGWLRYARKLRGPNSGPRSLRHSKPDLVSGGLQPLSHPSLFKERLRQHDSWDVLGYSVWWLSYIKFSPASYLLFCLSSLEYQLVTTYWWMGRISILGVYHVRTIYIGQQGLCGAEELRWRNRVLFFGFVSHARWHRCGGMERPIAMKQLSGGSEEQPSWCCPSVAACFRLYFGVIWHDEFWQKCVFKACSCRSTRRDAQLYIKNSDTFLDVVWDL